MNSEVRNRLVFFILAFLVIGFGCNTHKPASEKSEAGKEKLLSASQPDRPDWLEKKAVLADGYLTMVGSSGDCATEELSRAGALKDAQVRVMEYLANLAESKFKKISISDDLVKKSFDPNAAASSYRQFFSEHVAGRIKWSEIYGEKWDTPAGVAYRSFILIRMPLMVIEGSVRDFAKYNVIKIRQSGRNGNSREARRESQRVALFWKNMDPGILLEDAQSQEPPIDSNRSINVENFTPLTREEIYER